MKITIEAETDEERKLLDEQDAQHAVTVAGVQSYAIVGWVSVNKGMGFLPMRRSHGDTYDLRELLWGQIERLRDVHP